MPILFKWNKLRDKEMRVHNLSSAEGTQVVKVCGKITCKLRLGAVRLQNKATPMHSSTWG